MVECPTCRTALEAEFRFCPGCGRRLRTKVVEYFRGDRRLDDGDLRVSVYLAEPQNVRLSVWRDEAAAAAISLDPPEAARLAEFLHAVVRPRGGGASLVDALLATGRDLRDRLRRTSGSRIE